MIILADAQYPRREEDYFCYFHLSFLHLSILLDWSFKHSVKLEVWGSVSLSPPEPASPALSCYYSVLAGTPLLLYI